MENFTFHNPTKVVFGTHAMDALAENIRPFGKNVLLTYGGGSIKRSGIYDKVMEQLNDFEVREFSGIEPNPRIETLRKAVEVGKTMQPDIILAVGGGSVIDGSKLIASAIHYTGDPWDILSKDAYPTKTIPIGTVLTLSATGTEMNSNAVVTKWETHEKRAFSRPEVYPAFSILDPRNTFTVPKDQTAYGAVDAYSHVLEQYMTTTQNVPLQDRWAEGILLTIIEHAPRALIDPADYAVRANLMWSATLALNFLIGSGVNQDWATHRIEHEFSGFYDIPHAAGLAVITPRWMDVVAMTQKKTKLAQYGRRVFGLSGDDNSVAREAVNKTAEFFGSLGIPMDFTQWQVTNEHFDIMVERLVAMNIGETPLNAEDNRTILERCLVPRS